MLCCGLDDVVLWTDGPATEAVTIRIGLQQSINAIAAFLSNQGLPLSKSKSQQAFLVHPWGTDTQQATPSLQLHGNPPTWRKSITYLGLVIDYKLNWIPVVKAIRSRAAQVLQDDNVAYSGISPASEPLSCCDENCAEKAHRLHSGVAVIFRLIMHDLAVKSSPFCGLL